MKIETEDWMRKFSRDEKKEKLEELVSQVLLDLWEETKTLAERARSISPTKDSPITTPPRKTGHSSPLPTPLPTFKPKPSRTMADSELRKSTEVASIDKAMPKTLSLNLDLEPSKPSPPPASTLSRSGTLSWQQRPSSRGGGSRPTSLLSLDNKTTLSPRASPAPEPEAKEPSLADVAHALEKKDPTWFKQTADRGEGSAAYRRSQENESMDRGNRNVQLPGMAGRIGGNAEASSSVRNSLNSMQQDHISVPHKFFTTPPLNGAKSPLASPSARKSEDGTDSTTGRDGPSTSNLPVSQTQRDMSPERPISPTKGLGGFVQSAMLKRSDSLNKHKRAGSQVASSLSRNNSVAKDQRNDSVESAKETPKPLSINSQDGIGRQVDNHSSFSPSKTLDGRRWSPTKQSWLEGALSKTESPRPKSTNLQSPPMWLSELQKSKEASASAPDSTRVKADRSSEGNGSFRSSKEILNPASQSFEVPTARSNESSSNLEFAQDIKTEDSVVEKLDAEKKTFKNKVPMPQTSPGNLISGSKVNDRTPKPIPPVVTSPKPENYRSTPTSSEVGRSTLKSPELDSNKFSIQGQKPKSDTFVKKDFRAGLRSTRDLDQKPKTEEPEFKNVFGKLKKTETKNYVAPDELKENVLRGKTGLNVTGGPRPYQKKDEFKDSILKKKEEMKAGVSIKAKSPEPTQSEPVPEAIARRQKLGQTSTAERVAEKPMALAETKPVFSRTKSAIESITAASGTSSKPTIAAKPEAIRKVSLNKPLDGETISDATSISPLAVKHSMTQVEGPKLIPLEKKTSAPAQLQSTETSNSFANRFNPGLANILARGPPTASTTASSPRTTDPMGAKYDRAITKSPTEASSNQLNHVTKGRAKGPKRRAPGATQAEKKEDLQQKPSKTLPSLHKEVFNTPIPSISVSSKTIQGEKVEKQRKETDNRIASEPSESNSPIKKQAPPISTKPSVLAPTSPKPTSLMQTSTKAAGSEATTSKPVISKPSDFNEIAASAEKSPVSPLKSLKSPPLPGDKLKAMARISSNGVASERLQTPVPGGTLNDFFDNLSITKNDTDFNTQALLTNAATHNTKTRTLRREISEVASDGKESPLTAQQEYVLFEDRMYLCKHYFEGADGKQISEVFLWTGDRVAPAAVEDVQVFCRAEARDAGCKLQNFSQGKESTNFLNALGGIVVTRRSNSATYMLCGRRHIGHVVFDEVDFSAESLCSGFPFIIATTGGDLYLWKGRGANADEIGCARLIGMDLGLTGEIEEIQEGDEPAELLAILKLEHQDLAVDYWSHKAVMDKYTSRLFVIDTDVRPWSASSLSNFAVNMWKRRPSSTSLNEASEGSIKEISPYAQSDISEDKIFVLDTYFEIWVVVGSQTRSLFSSFAKALSFAQDYGMLSVSIQDRPCLPRSNVLFLGATGIIPASVRTAFRKWDDRLIKQQNSWTSVTVCMSLQDALQALESLVPSA